MGSIPELPFWPANETETLLEAACRDPAHREAFLRALPTCPLFLLTDPAAPQPTLINGQLPAGEELRLAKHEIDGTFAITAFTSAELLSFSVQPGTPYISLLGKDVFACETDSPIALNPKGPFGRLLSQQDVEALRTGFLPLDGGARVAERGTAFRFGHLADPPAYLLEPLRRACRKCAGIRTAYVGMISFAAAPDMEPRVIVGVECDNFEQAAAAIRPVASQVHDLPGGTLDITNLADDDLSRAMRSIGFRFFTRSWLGRLLG